ncbi:acyl-CoA dehydrogenase family protein [Eilatimonas milleporae]|uniref:Acyl-CoA dehydrogenase n=1 Tax=Eilatimonas milleporae TaxID=911205 RepID=A0A3M0CI63_9PROT|nr:acyl-CoA dehydrogenase family protein [Eilatimonas milleporae]RMB08447.1 acyl-CoA dehydrogenase/hypothetical protein [Eilatimonas milleporae]
MALVLTEEQQLLKDSADGFFTDKAPVAQLRRLRDDKDETGYDTGLWRDMAEMGFAGLLVGEDHGGTGFGHVGAGIVAEAMARTLAASPFMASAVTAAGLIDTLASDAVKADLLAKIAGGDTVISPALDEKSRHDLTATATRAAKNASGNTDGDTYTLTGAKTFVPDGHVADHFLVLARTDGTPGDTAGLSLFLVDKGTPGLIVDRTVMADSRNWAKLTLEGVQLPADRLIGTEGDAFDGVDAALDRARIIYAAELLGIAQVCLDTTVDYLKDRKQFGVAIGTFQGLQHRLAHLYSEVETARSAILKGLQAADKGGSLAWFASLAKAKACKVAELATNEAIQMHGGIGMTDEYDIGFYIKRARTVQQLYGDFYFHSDRFARQSGY